MKRLELTLSEIDEFEKRYPSYKEQTRIYKMLLNAQKPLLEDPKSGTTIGSITGDFLDKLQNQSIKDGKPLFFFLEPSVFNFEIIQKTFLAIMDGIKRLDIDGKKDYSKFIESATKLIPELIEKRLKNDNKFFLSCADKFESSHAFLEMIVDSLIQPLMKKFANNVKKEGFLDAWNRTICPICGKIPFIVVKNEEEVWRFRCTFCEAEYAMNIFKCQNCENEDFARKEFFFIEKKEAFEVIYCQECSVYFKVINEHKLSESIPMGLEDLHTNFLDEIAQNKGLKRLDTQKL